MTCPKCQGFMLRETMFDHRYTGNGGIPALRCVNCGKIVFADEVERRRVQEQRRVDDSRSKDAPPRLGYGARPIVK